MSSSNLVGDSSSSPIIEDYDVFLSFRGEDTRFGFVSHLYKALVDRDIKTFRDDKKLDKGKEISPELLTAIERSRFFVIVLSENYASSRWCLAELDHILDCSHRRRSTERVLPVFYNVDPSMVRKQTGSFEVAFRRHEIDHLEGSSDAKVERWREALRETADLSGFDTRNRYEADVVKEIVAKIYDKLNHQLLGVDEPLIGMKGHVNEIRSKLRLGSGGVRFVGIFGMGGIGKTTVAKVIYNKIYHQFEGCSYVKEVRKSHTDLSSPQRQLALDIIKEDDLRIHNTDRGISILKSGLGNKRVLLVLDDVDHSSQFEALAGHKNWFGEGSRIIITSRDERLLDKIGVDERYAMRLLDEYQSIQLFSLKAFEQERPPDDYYWESHQVVRYANGLPLALKVLGSDFYKLSTDEWKGKLAGMRRDPPKDIMDVLKISYEGLGEQDKKIFLHVACFLKGKGTTFATNVLNSCGLNPDIGLRVLVQKSLIKKSVYLQMHDLVEEMGRLIIRQESPDDPAERRWLWDEEDIYDVLTTNTGTKAIEGITLRPTSESEWSLSADVFNKMTNLKFLTILDNHGCIKFPHGLAMLPNKLIILDWKRCPLECWPPGFQPRRIVQLNLEEAINIKQPWIGKMNFPGLTSIELSHCEYLTGIPDLSGSPNIATFTLSGCAQLVEVHPSIGGLRKLTRLAFSNCSSLKSIPFILGLKSLESFSMSGCSKLEKCPQFQDDMKRLKRLDLSESGIKELCSSIGNLTGLTFMNFSLCENLMTFPDSVCKDLPALTLIAMFGCKSLTRIPDLSGAPNLAKLYLDGCERLVEVHSSIGGLTKLEELNLERCHNLKELCSSIGNLNTLHRLDLAWCTNLTIVPDIICKLTALTNLNLRGCSMAKSFPAIHSLRSLETLILDCCDLSEIPKEFSCWFTRLKSLYLSGNNFVNLPDSISQLSSVSKLYLDGCPRLEALPELPSSRISVHARNCPSLKRLTPTLAKSESSDSIHGDFFLDVTKLLHMHSRKSRRVDFWLSANNVTEFFRFSHQSIWPSSASFCIPLPCNLANLEGFAHCVVVEGRDDWGARTTIKKNLGYTSFDSLGREEGITGLNISFEVDKYSSIQILKCGVHLVYKDDDAELSQSNCCIEIEDHVSTELRLKERINLVENEVLPNGQENLSAKRNHPNNGDQYLPKPKKQKINNGDQVSLDIVVTVDWDNIIVRKAYVLRQSQDW